MGTMTAQGTLPVAGGDINAEPLTDTFNHIMTTYNNKNIVSGNCTTTGSDGIMTFDTASTKTTNLTMDGANLIINDNDDLVFGDGTDYWWTYDSSNTKLDLYSTDVDGGGTNGIVISINDGTPDLTFTGSLVLAAGETITYGTGETIGGDNTDLTVTSGGAINLTAGTDVVIPANIGVTFGTGEKIEGDNTDLTVTSGGAINLTATTDVVVPANIGITFGTGEKIEGDNTDLTITSGGAINLTAVTDIVVPTSVGITFGTGEKIEGDDTDLTVTSGADINLTATGDVNIPSGVGITFGDDGEKIEGDGTDLTISGNNINVTAAADVLVTGDVILSNAAGPQLADEAATATNPTLIPNKAETDTGFGWAAADTLTAVVGGAENMRIGSGAFGLAGNAGSTVVTIGTNGGGSVNQYFQLVSEQYDGAEAEGFQIMETYSNGTNNQVILGGGGSDYNAANLLYFYTGANDSTRTGTKRMTIDASGNINIDGLTASQDVQTDASKNLTSVSDKTWKADEGLIADALDILKQLKPSYFTWKRDATGEDLTKDKQIVDKDTGDVTLEKRPVQPRLAGFYAQDVYAAFPEGSPGGANTDANGEDHWGLNSRALLALTVKALQELVPRIEALEA